MLGDVRAELGVELLVPALAGEVQVHVTERRQEAVRVADGERPALLAVVDLELVVERQLRPRDLPLEHPLGADGGEVGASTVGGADAHGAGGWAVGAHDHAPVPVRSIPGLLADKQQLERLDIAETEELRKIKDMAKERQLTAHLERFFLDRANIEGLDAAKRAVLAAYGIETAAEVEDDVVRSIRGFGDAITSTLCAWRKQCEGNFRFDPASAVPISEVNKVKVRFAAQRQPIQAKLTSGVEALKRCSPPYSSYIEDEWYDIRDRARRLAQAEADLSLLAVASGS